jgi:preprotein translocase subunit SecY
MANLLESFGRQGSFTGSEVVAQPGLGFKLLAVLTLTTGTCFIMWLGEQITERGIGNGISLIIFAGIVAGMPGALGQTYQKAQSGELDLLKVILLVIIIFGTIAAICFFERSYRRIPVQYNKRMVGRKMYGGTTTYLPLKLNVAGVIPPIFASSVLLFPSQLAGMVESEWIVNILGPLQDAGDWRHNVVFVALIIFFAFFYTAVTSNPVDLAENLKKSGGSIPGIRPGKKTADYIDRVLTRITCAGSLYISAVCILPALLQNWFQVPFYFGGTGLLIVVGVALDTVQQIESHLITRNYEGITGPKGPRIRGRISARPV